MKWAAKQAHGVSNLKHSQSLIVSISALRCTHHAINSHRFHSSLKQSVFLFSSSMRCVVLGGPVHRTPPISRCFIFFPPFGGRAHLHGAISYVLRRPITRVDSGSDRKSCRALPNQTPHGYPDVAARPAFPFSWYIASAHANPTVPHMLPRSVGLHGRGETVRPRTERLTSRERRKRVPRGH